MSRLHIVVRWLHFFFFKQKTAYEMRISDWSSDVCSSDLPNVLIAACVKTLQDGRRLVVFPEGTRTVPGLPMKLKRGAASIIVRSGQIGRASCRERVCQYV